MEDTVAFFESRGVKLKVERGERVFPVSDKASDIVDCLYNYIASSCNLIHARAKKIITENGRIKGVSTFDSETIEADNVLISTGGKSYPATGSTGDGYDLAKQAGHTVSAIQPSLVPLEIHEGFCSGLAGLSLRNVEIKLIDTVNNI